MAAEFPYPGRRGSVRPRGDRSECPLHRRHRATALPI